MKRILIILLTLTLLQNCMDAFVYSETQKKTSSSPNAAILALITLSANQTVPSTNTGTGVYSSVGGTITGLTSSGLVLQNNGVDLLPVPVGATSFYFNTEDATDITYAITVYSQPTGLTCTVSNGTGVGIENTNISIICSSTISYSISGTIMGLAVSGLVLQNNAGDYLTVSSGVTTFSFNNKIATYETCSVTNGTLPTDFRSYGTEKLVESAVITSADTSAPGFP